MRHQGILARHTLIRNNRLASRGQSPTARAERLVQDAPVLDLGQVHDAVRLHFNVLGRNGLLQHLGRFLAEGLLRETVEGSRPVHPAAAGVKGDWRVIQAVRKSVAFFILRRVIRLR